MFYNTLFLQKIVWIARYPNFIRCSSGNPSKERFYGIDFKKWYSQRIFIF